MVLGWHALFAAVLIQTVVTELIAIPTMMIPIMIAIYPSIIRNIREDMFVSPISVALSSLSAVMTY